jgi:hypothetical protein
MPPPNQIVLAWTVDATNTPFGPVQAAAALGAVPLYANLNTDPVLGQNFGLTVETDLTTTAGPLATRTLKLNMTTSGTRKAPPPFPCRPRTSTPPTLPYPLRAAVTLPGSFFPSNGATAVPTTMTQIPSLVTGDSIQFLSQQGVFYAVAAGTTPTSINLTAPYTGTTGNTGAFKEKSAPVTLAAFYSSSDLDTAGVATTPAIPTGAGARTVSLTYKDSLGAGPLTVTTSLTGRRPAAVALAGGSIDIAEIVNITVASTGAFGNSVGEITLVELSGALPPISPTATPGTGIGAGQGDNTFFVLTDEAQLLISRHLAYLPPSYFALAQQGASAPQLVGDFSVTTHSTRVPTSVDQGSVLSAGDTIQFASQPNTIYTVAAVSGAPTGTGGVVTLTTPYTGINTNNTGTQNIGTNSNAGTQGNIGTTVIDQETGATRVSPSAAFAPTNDHLAAVLGQFVDPGNAGPPPNPPLTPGTMVPPVTVGGAVPFLSGFFTKTLQLALAGVPVVAQPITFI